MVNQQNHARHINAPLDYERAKDLRRKAPPAERLLWEALRQLPKDLALKFRRQHPIHPYIVDFACIACKLIVEIDGSSHDTRQGYDEERSNRLRILGYTVLRFTNEEVYRNREGVVREIVQKSQERLHV
jgi:very-short-patch-repair endonuclease